MITPEDFIDSLIDYMDQSVMEMLLCVKAEEYEKADALRMEIDDRIEVISTWLVESDATMLTADEVADEMYYIYWATVKKWEEALGFPEEMRT